MRLWWMLTDDPSYICSPSTTWTWKKVKLSRPPQGTGRQGGASRPKFRLALRNRNKPLWIEVQFRGGASSSWIVRTRGGLARFDGFTAIEDVMRWANGELDR